MKLAEVQWPEIKRIDREKTVAVIPVGSNRNSMALISRFRSIHLLRPGSPKTSRRAFPDLRVPTGWSGVSAHHIDFPGSITIRARVFIDLLHDICASLHHHGFRRIVLLNGHGGNRSSLEVLGQELFVEFGLTVNTLAYWDVVPDLVKSLKKSKSKGMGHSGELETALMLYLAPQWVNRGAIRTASSASKKKARWTASNATST